MSLASAARGWLRWLEAAAALRPMKLSNGRLEWGGVAKSADEGNYWRGYIHDSAMVKYDDVVWFMSDKLSVGLRLFTWQNFLMDPYNEAVCEQQFTLEVRSQGGFPCG